MLCFPLKSIAQKKNQAILDTINKDELGEVSDHFQEAFFEALAQKGAENYNKAIDILKKIKDLNKDNEFVVYFELGENYKALDRYNQSEKFLQKALAIHPDNRTIQKELFQVYSQSHNTHKAIDMGEILAKNNLKYNEDLAQLYRLEKNYKSALKSLDKIDEKKGRNDFRASLRRKIYKETDDKDFLETYLKDKIRTNSDNILNYADLIYIYVQTNQLKKAEQTAQTLLQKNPQSPQAHLALYKIYLDKGETDDAVAAMEVVLNSDEIGNDQKEDVINDFKALLKTHPEYENDLVQVLGEQSTQGHQSNQQLGEYYIGKDNEKALSYFEKALAETPQKYNLIKETLILQVREKQFSKALKLSKNALDIYPSQPFLYLMRGIAENRLQDYKSAKQSLNDGIDFVIDNPKLEVRYYEELAIAYKSLDDSQKSTEFEQKARALKQKTE